MILYDALVIKSWANRATQRFAEEDKSRFTGLDEALARRRLRLLVFLRGCGGGSPS